MKTITYFILVLCFILFLYGCSDRAFYDHENPQAYDEYWGTLQSNNTYILEPPKDSYIIEPRVFLKRR